MNVGALNSYGWDQRTTWSNGLIANDRAFNNGGGYPATQFFNGDTTTFASTGGSGGGNSSGTVDLGNYFLKVMVLTELKLDVQVLMLSLLLVAWSTIPPKLVILQSGYGQVFHQFLLLL